MKREELTRYHTYDDWYTGYEILEFPPQTTEDHNKSLDTHVEESDAEWYSIEEVDKLLDFNETQLSETEEKLKEAYKIITKMYVCLSWDNVNEKYETIFNDIDDKATKWLEVKEGWII